MKTINVTVYDYRDLSEKAQQKALAKLSDINVNYNWWQPTYEDAEQVGLKITGFNLDRGDITGNFLEDAKEVAKSIVKNHGKTCKTYADARNYLKDLHKIKQQMEDEDEIEKLDKEFEYSLLDSYLSTFREEYNYLTSKEQIEESIIANDYQFFEDGRIFHL